MDTIAEKFRSLYVHFPFCEAKCHYCDFFSLPEKQVGELQRAKIHAAILKEFDSRLQELERPMKTVFLGGGTPSLAPLAVLGEVVRRIPRDESTELTMEANPSSVSREKAEQWRKMGITRVSMGVQALDDDRLKWLGRVHTKAEVFEALEALFEAGIGRVSIDYIVGVPAQKTETIRGELFEALSKFPSIDHVSAYLLTLKPSNSRFKELPDDTEQLEHLRTVSQALAEKGFEQYEISNFSKPGARALHNENYWLGGAYLGIGPSAHSYSPQTAKRSKNWASLGKYVELIESGKSPVEWDETLTAEQLRLEYLMLRLRRSEGVDFEEYGRLFGKRLVQENRARIDQWLKRGLCRLDHSRLRLTADGFFLSDQILSNII